MARTSIVQLITTAAIGTADAAASVDMQDDGVIMGIYMDLDVNSVAADGDGGRMEVSFGSTNAMGTNDARQVISRLTHTTAFATAAAGVVASTHQYVSFGDGIPFFGGERIFLHTANLVTGVVNRACAHLIVAFKSGPVSRRR